MVMNEFSVYLKNKKPIIKKLIDRLVKSYSYVSVLGTDVTGISYNVDKTSSHVGPSSLNECGFVLKVYHNGIYSEYSTTSIEEDNLDAIEQAITDLISFNTINKKMNIPLYDEEKIVKQFARKNAGRSFNPDEIIKTLKGYIKDSCEKYKEIVNAQCSLENIQVSKMYISNKKDLEQFYSWSGGRTSALAKKEDNMKYSYDGFGSPCMEQVLHDIKLSLDYTSKLSI